MVDLKEQTRKGQISLPLFSCQHPVLFNAAFTQHCVIFPDVVQTTGLCALTRRLRSINDGVLSKGLRRWKERPFCV